MSSSPPDSPSDSAPDSPPDSPPDQQRSGPRFNAWNLLLLVPLLMLITPWFNSDGPRLIGLPFFYWFQFLFVFVGVACVWIVYLMTRKPANRSKSDDAEGRS